MLLKIPHDDAHKGPLLVGYYIVRISSPLAVLFEAIYSNLKIRSLYTLALVSR